MTVEDNHDLIIGAMVTTWHRERLIGGLAEQLAVRTATIYFEPDSGSLRRRLI